jgi:hypothetical protein
VSQRKVGFVTMGATAKADDVREIGIGMLGYPFMGKAHANAYKTLSYMMYPPPLRPRLVLPRVSSFRQRGRVGRVD